MTKPKKDATVIQLPNRQILFGQLLKERRSGAKITQGDFAEMMHVTRNTVINWEADKSKPDYNLIPEICSILGIQLHELFHMQAENTLSELENRVISNLRTLSPVSQRVVDKMILFRDRVIQSVHFFDFVSRKSRIHFVNRVMNKP